VTSALVPAVQHRGKAPPPEQIRKSNANHSFLQGGFLAGAAPDLLSARCSDAITVLKIIVQAMMYR
jgi:hypothetical protein